jgi:molybdate transport system substrate-binding protein
MGALLLAGEVGAATVADATAVAVSAAVSLKSALSGMASDCAAQTGATPQFNFGATGHLLAQIREGAPVDVFIAASDEQMDQAQTAGLIDPASRAVIAGNEMVLIVPRGSSSPIRSFADLKDSAIRRIAIGQPKTVPAGLYATQVLAGLKLESALRERIVYGASVRQVLDYVARGEVDAGIVYATDARDAGDAVRVIAAAQADWHEPIHYVAAVVTESARRMVAVHFIEFLRGDAAQRKLREAGFTPPPAATQPTTRSG